MFWKPIICTCGGVLINTKNNYCVNSFTLLIIWGKPYYQDTMPLEMHMGQLIRKVTNALVIFLCITYISVDSGGFSLSPNLWVINYDKTGRESYILRHQAFSILVPAHPTYTYIKGEVIITAKNLQCKLHIARVRDRVLTP